MEGIDMTNRVEKNNEMKIFCSEDEINYNQSSKLQEHSQSQTATLADNPPKQKQNTFLQIAKPFYPKLLYRKYP